jgi:hypothetical protein
MSKYGARKTVCAQAHTHDSGMEASRCNDLTAMEEQGRISRLELQPEFPVWINGKKVCTYVADFAWFVADCRIIEDVKGMRTPVFNLKKKLVEACHPGTVITIWPPKKRKTRKAKA